MESSGMGDGGGLLELSGLIVGLEDVSERSVVKGREG